MNRLLVADSRGSFTPGYAWLAKRACAHPGLLPVASFAAPRDEKTESVLVYSMHHMKYALTVNIWSCPRLRGANGVSDAVSRGVGHG